MSNGVMNHFKKVPITAAGEVHNLSINIDPGFISYCNRN